MFFEQRSISNSNLAFVFLGKLATQMNMLCLFVEILDTIILARQDKKKRSLTC